jgi:hypothetical protein
MSGQAYAKPTEYWLLCDDDPVLRLEEAKQHGAVAQARDYVRDAEMPESKWKLARVLDVNLVEQDRLRPGDV